MSSHHDHDHSGHGHDGHNHDHNHDHDHDHGHDHSDEVSPALQTLIWKQIDFDKIRTLNESEADAGRAIVEKSWQNRLDPTPVLASDADEQILMFVPYVVLLVFSFVFLPLLLLFPLSRKGVHLCPAIFLDPQPPRPWPPSPPPD